MEITKYFGNPDLLASAEELVVTIGTESMTLKVAPHGNPPYRAAALLYTDIANGKEEDDIKVAQANIALISEYLLVGWENVSFGGKELQYSVENSLMLLTNSTEIAIMVDEKAQEMAKTRTKKLTKLKKN